MSRFLTSARMRLASVIFAGLPVWLATPAKALHSQEQGTTTSTLNSVSGLDVGLDTVSKEIASWLPESVVLFGKVDPVAQWLDHPLRTRWVASDAFKRLWRTPEALQLRGGITVAEFALGGVDHDAVPVEALHPAVHNGHTGDPIRGRAKAVEADAIAAAGPRSDEDEIGDGEIGRAHV